MLYAELTAYGGLPRPHSRRSGDRPGPTPDVQQGVTPYWRLALEPHWGDHYLMVGTFGMYGQIAPRAAVRDRDRQLHRRRLRLAVPVRRRPIQRHRQADRHHRVPEPERERIFAERSSNINNWLNSFKANASFVWDHTYSSAAAISTCQRHERLLALRIRLP